MYDKCLTLFCAIHIWFNTLIYFFALLDNIKEKMSTFEDGTDVLFSDGKKNGSYRLHGRCSMDTKDSAPDTTGTFEQESLKWRRQLPKKFGKRWTNK